MKCKIMPLAAMAMCMAVSTAGAQAGIGVSAVDSRYFADETGKAWIPVGCNICFDRNAGGSAKTRELYDGWMTKFAADGGVLPDFSRSIVVRVERSY